MVRPKKHLGQHFLTDHNIARKIVEQIPADVPVLEIGPGKGILSRYLLEKPFPSLKLVEVDEEAAAFLSAEFPSLAGHLIRADILETDPGRFFPGKFNIIGNFPYNISSQIFFQILAHHDRVGTVVCMIQREVARRIASPPGSREYGILSVLLQTFYNIEYLFTVGEKVFIPEPKVKSAVIRLTRNSRELTEVPVPFYFQVVKTAFNQRRKTLRNALQRLEQASASLPEDLASRRAEALDVGAFIRLATLLYPG